MPGDLMVTSTYVAVEQQGWFEDEMHLFTDTLAPEVHVAIDVGAGFGYYTTLLARSAGPTGRVFAFEPNATTASHLRRTLQLNGLASRVDLHPATAVGAAPQPRGTGGPLLATPRNAPELSRVADPAGPLHDPAACTPVAVTSLDAFFGLHSGTAVHHRDPHAGGAELEAEAKQSDAATPNLEDLLRVGGPEPPSGGQQQQQQQQHLPLLLRLDCCGAEPDVLRGSEELLRRFAPILLWVTADASGQSHIGEVGNLLSSMGYATYRHLPCGLLVPFDLDAAQQQQAKAEGAVQAGGSDATPAAAAAEQPPGPPAAPEGAAEGGGDGEVRTAAAAIAAAQAAAAEADGVAAGAAAAASAAAPAAVDIAYLLNLVSMKPESARRLEARGIAAAQQGPTPTPTPAPAATPGSDAQLFSQLSRRPYATQLLKRWVESPPLQPELRAGLTALLKGTAPATAQQPGAPLPATRRLQLLGEAKAALYALCVQNPTLGRLSSLARCVHELGDRSAYVEAVGELLRRMAETKKSAGASFELDAEPFLPCLPEGDAEVASCATADVFFEATARFAYVSRSAFTSAFVPTEQLSGVIHHLQAVISSGFYVDRAASRLTALYQRTRHAALREAEELGADTHHPCGAGGVGSAALPLIEPAAGRLHRDRIALGGGGGGGAAVRLTTGYYPVHPVEAYCLPDALRGVSVCVVGTFEGYWAVEALKRGARSVTVVGVEGEADWDALDGVLAAVVPAGGEVRRVRVASLADVSAKAGEIGTHDLVLCYDQLQRARHPQLLLDALRSLTGRALRCTAVVSQKEGLALHMPCPAAWRPTPAALVGMLQAAGFPANHLQLIPETSTAVVASH